MFARLITLWLLAALGMCLPSLAAALCDVTYKVQPGDTLFSVAEFHYGDREKWTLIYYANQGVLSGSNQVAAGQDIYIPCPAENVNPAAVQAEPEVEVQQSTAELTLLTGSNFAPFADKSWPQQGLATELITAALAAAPSPVDYAILWEDDRSRHLFPLLDQKAYDMGFPWIRPDCAADPQEETCANFHFSDPLMDVPMMLFKRQGAGFDYTQDSDMDGARLCRPAGYSIHDLDRAGRRWVSDGVVTLIQPESPEACFEELMAGHVDAVTMNLFLGATKIVAMGLRGRVVPIDMPLSEEQLHVVISKTHWRGTTHLYRINAGLAALRDSGAYEEIKERHLQIFWDQFK